VASNPTSSWDQFSEDYQSKAAISTDAAHYGPDVADEADLRLLGDLKGKRVLDLGCGAAQSSIAFAKAGAAVVGVDLSEAQLSHGRRLCEQNEVKVELRVGDMADLAFLRPASIDVAFSSFAFQYVEDLNRVFRQVHRVLKVGAPFVFSLPHPAYFVLDEQSGTPPKLERSYFDRSPENFTWEGVAFTGYHHTFADLYMGLIRSSYKVDLVLEPAPTPGAPRSWFWSDAMDWLPRTLVVRARKEGS
jgi:ubiquinone/menaquinone biosynthesis C-methylase UbiE